MQNLFRVEWYDRSTGKAVVYLKLQSQHLPGTPEEKYENS
jgi:hypothetical protein